jgi:2'-deoxynucleoside 5'-phosphate N-hydrolase
MSDSRHPSGVPIYFAGAISAGRSDAALYARIIAALRELGHEVWCEHVGSPDLTAGGEADEGAAIFRRDMEWLAEVARGGGALVAEISVPSTGVGYEIASARYRFKMPVICLFRPAYVVRCTAMVAGDSEITLIKYADGEIGAMLTRLARAIANKTKAPKVVKRRS